MHIPVSRLHRVKCRTEVVNNPTQSLETCKMLKTILSELKFVKISESVVPQQTLFQHEIGYV